MRGSSWGQTRTDVGGTTGGTRQHMQLGQVVLEDYVQGCSMGAAAGTGLCMDHSDLQHTSREQLGLQTARGGSVLHDKGMAEAGGDSG